MSDYITFSAGKHLVTKAIYDDDTTADVPVIIQGLFTLFTNTLSTILLTLLFFFTHRCDGWKTFSC